MRLELLCGVCYEAEGLICISAIVSICRGEGYEGVHKQICPWYILHEDITQGGKIRESPCIQQYNQLSKRCLLHLLAHGPYYGLSLEE